VTRVGCGVDKNDIGETPVFAFSSAKKEVELATRRHAALRRWGPEVGIAV
jgi:hypothetical protein